MAQAMTADLSRSEARRVVLAAQGFDRPRPKRPAGAREIARTIRQLGLLQIDFVNVLAPAHYQVPFSRLGPYRRGHLDDLIYRRREFTEQWAREASIVPMETWPLLRHRMEHHRARPWGFDEILEKHPGYADWVLEQVRARGPLLAEDLPEGVGKIRRLEGWHSSVPRAALEAHFGRGLLAIADRRPNFARTYDLAERVIPAEHHGRRVEREEAQRELLRMAARALGIGTADDLADYYRMPLKEARPRLAELAAAGDVREVRVAGWRAPAYLHRAARVPPVIDAASLLSPFDPVIWHRPRAERLFEFAYRIEIFVPEPQRRWGYYVLPFLLGERLVARVDLKADRAARRLAVPAAYLETGADGAEVAQALAGELWAWAGWLGLETVTVEKKHGAFARQLAAALGKSRG
ncbi:MAG TPA: crosslink repair DNA glycosylase YcaQ family protein [Bryobacteraceae bacterium]|nr:crosslink repair DNA glycosylase YcaQ family protein [Bryobacteraceae bacterium]